MTPTTTRGGLIGLTLATMAGQLAVLGATGALGGGSAAAVIALGALAAVGGVAVIELRERTVAANLRQARSCFDRTIEPTLWVAVDGRIGDANDAACALLGVPHSAICGAPWAQWFTDPEAAAITLDHVRLRGSAREATLSLRKDGTRGRRVAITATLLAAEAGAPPRILVTLSDVSEAAATAAEAQRRLAYERSLVEASPDPLLALSLDGLITDVTSVVSNKVGVPREDLLGTPFTSLFADADAARQAWERPAIDRRVHETLLTLRHRGGTVVEVAFTGTPRRDESGAVVGILASLRDVSAARRAERERDAKDRLVAGIARLNEAFQGQISTRELARRIITEMATYAECEVGAFFAVDPDGDPDALHLVGSHAYTHRKHLATSYRPGEGVVGQAALEKKQILLLDVPEDYVRVSSGIGDASPRAVCVTPLLIEGRVNGMLELASFKPFSDTMLEYFRQAAPPIAVALEAATARERASIALQRAQTLAAELEAQQETLRNTNAELEEQTAQLKVSEQKMRSQQAEIELANTELTQKNDLLERQRQETEQARKVLAAQAEEVALASKYKSEFLANMSHELRTPLNSLLLLARSLRDNATGNLSEEQVDSASVIFDSGSDLLNLINEILDLSKIEAGKMELRPEEIEIADLERQLMSQFGHMARAQGLTLEVSSDDEAAPRIVSDSQRLGQVLKNLLGNALKFTETGGVKVRFARPADGVQLRRSGLDPRSAIAVHVIDTGIGIPLDKQKVIFEAFQQADSGDRRRFGGTGLGLSISRELATLLGGEIQLVSKPGEGSTFTVYFPLSVSGAPVSRERAPAKEAHATPAPIAVAPKPASTPRPAVEDDRDRLGDSDRVVLVIEDDTLFARILLGHIRERGFKGITATSGEEGLELARKYRPHGVILDIHLPNMDGWAVLNTLKQDMSLRHIPVHIVSVEEYSAQNMRLGAIGHVSKPVGREQIDEMLKRLESAVGTAPKRVLVVEDDDIMRRETVRLVSTGNVAVTEVATGAAALEAVRGEPFHLVVLDLGLPDMQGLELLRRLAEAKVAMPPVIVHTNRDLTTEEQLMLRSYAESIIVKDVRSQERLIDEVALFLHRVVRDLPEENRRAILHLHESNEPLRGKTVLIVEDDMRTMFAMARMLAGHGINPIKAENGERALALLAERPDVDVVLMDMMMPVLDGYEAIRRIRAQSRWAKLPIVALTAKAMKEDRQKCLEAGATDYLSKPVDPDRLVSLLRVLLCR